VSILGPSEKRESKEFSVSSGLLRLGPRGLGCSSSGFGAGHFRWQICSVMTSREQDTSLKKLANK